MDLLTKNDQQLKELHGFNRNYAETLVGYLRAHWGKDALAREDTIADLLVDMVTAQADGIASKDHFGKAPQAAADEILAELPPAPKAQWLIQLWPLFNALWVLMFVYADAIILSGETVGLDILWQQLAIPFLFIAVAPLFRGISFNQIKTKTKWRASIAVVLIIAIYAVMFLLPDTAPLTTNQLQIGLGIVIAALIVCNLGLSFWLRRLTLPWFLYWLIVGPSVRALIGATLPVALVVVLLVVFMGAVLALTIYQSKHLHFVFQAQGGKQLHVNQ